jgi:tetratricopeptide (TPR) repeat protein
MSTIAAVIALALAVPAAADGVSGAYLASRHAGYQSDFAKAAEYSTRALQGDPQNPMLLEDAVNAYVGLGRFDRAQPYAERLARTGAQSQIGNMALVEELAQKGDYRAILDRQAKGELRIAPLVDGLVKAWAEVGDGRMSDALKSFDAVAEKTSTRAFGLYHKALALALAGDLEAADAILSSTGNETLNLNRRGMLARIEILSQLERNEAASKALTDAFGPDLEPMLAQMKARLDAGKTLPVTVVTSANDGMAEVFYSIAAALKADTPESFSLAFSRTAEALQPSHEEATLLSAGLLEKLQRYDLAIAAYDQIPTDSPYYDEAELGRANALKSAGRDEEAVEVLKRLTETHDSVPEIFVTLGDSLRRLDRYAEASAAYDRAIQLYKVPAEGQWVVYFARGIAEEREKNWDRAEADFRMALKLRPDQPQVLNYLGYSYVEMKRNLDEALDMIQRAVKARPDDGYITDSLGWVYYRLGRYDEAVVEMEKAAGLMPVDPVINDHLGDVYWAVGRHREAQFQWRRAMSFGPEEVDAQRIRRKLEVGLDTVLKEEGAEPLAVAKDG